MLDWLKKLLASSMLTNLVRHGLTALGALLIAQGIPAEIVEPWQDATLSLLQNAIPLIIALIWSILEKKYLKSIPPIK